MSANFDLAVLRQQLNAIYGVPLALSSDFLSAREKGTLYSNGEAILDEAIRCVVAGWEEHLEELLQMAEQFLSASIEQGEMPAGIDLGDVYKNLGLSRWLRGSVVDHESFQKVAEHYLATPSADVRWPDLNSFLPDLIAGKQFDEAIRLVEQCGLPKPEGLRDAKSAPKLAFLIAVNRGVDTDEPSELPNATIKFLRKNVWTNMLAKGNYNNMAIWMMIAFWKPERAANQCVRKCLEFLPLKEHDSA